MGERFGGRQKGTPNKATSDVKAAFAKRGHEFVEALYRLTLSKDENVRLRALALVFDRWLGKAPQPLTGADGEGPVLSRIERVIVDERPVTPPEQPQDDKPVVH